MSTLDPRQLSTHAGAYAALYKLYLQLDANGRQQLDANVAAGVDQPFAAGWRQWRDVMLASVSPKGQQPANSPDQRSGAADWNQRAAA